MPENPCVWPRKITARGSRLSAMPRPWVHCSAVPIHPSGSGTPSVAARATDGHRRSVRSALASLLAAIRRGLQDREIGGLQVPLLLVLEELLTLVVQGLGLERVLLRHGLGVAILAIGSRKPRLLGIGQHFRRGVRLTDSSRHQGYREHSHCHTYRDFH